MRYSNITIFLLTILTIIVVLLLFLILLNIYLSKYIQNSRKNVDMYLLKLKSTTIDCKDIYNEFRNSEQSLSIILPYNSSVYTLSDKLKKYLMNINHVASDNFRFIWLLKRIIEYRKIKKEIDNFLTEFSVNFRLILVEIDKFKETLFVIKKSLELILEFINEKDLIRKPYFECEINSLYSQINLIEYEKENYSHKNDELFLVNQRLANLIEEVNWSDNYEYFLFSHITNEVDYLLNSENILLKTHILLSKFKNKLIGRKKDFKELHYSKLKDSINNLIENFNEIKRILYIEQKSKEIVEKINFSEIYFEVTANIKLFLEDKLLINNNLESIKIIKESLSIIKHTYEIVQMDNYSFSEKLECIKESCDHIYRIKDLIDSLVMNKNIIL